jgi:hypothetical protein
MTAPVALAARTAAAQSGAGVAPRPMPYPFRAAVAICSDLDETPDLPTYVESLRFLNDTGPTRFGNGVGLEVGDTIYFDMPAGHCSYWNVDDRGRGIFRTLIQSGHIDCLHSFGDLATTRGHAARALDELARHDCALGVWIDHAIAPSNFGADRMQGRGDVAGNPAFHADLTCAFGIEYVWRGRVTSVTGQGVSRRLGGIFRSDHALASGITLAKESIKGVVGRVGSVKYRLHPANVVVRPARLRSGHRVHEFMRCNPHWGGVSCGDTSDGLADVLDTSFFTRLVDRGGVCILYTHLGKGIDIVRGFAPASVAALRALARERAAGRILVSTTRRLLGYCRAVQEAAWTVRAESNHLVIAVATRGPAGQLARRDLEGLTFYSPDPAHTHVTIDGIDLPGVDRNPPDETGRPSVSLPRRPLEFPRL